MRLTDMTVRNAKPKDKTYKLADGQGLYLEISPIGSRYWRMKYRAPITKQEKKLCIGVYPEISLATAREEVRLARQLLRDGKDPSLVKQDKKQQAFINISSTFQAVALEWHEKQSGRWGIKHFQNILRKLERDVFPYIGNKPIADIDTPTLLYTLQQIENRGALDILSRVRQICSQVFIYGIQTGRCQNNPTINLQKGAFKTRKTTHFAAIDARELPEFLNALQRNDARLFPRTRRAILLSLLTFVRPGELRKAEWSEIDFEAKEWRIPAHKMKMRREHIVPLSEQAIAILNEQKQETGRINTPLVFPSQIKPRQPMSDGTVNIALKKLGFQGRMNAHGFRALARSTIREKLDYAPDIIEAQLAHKAAGPLGEAYARSTFYAQRKTMMQDWADYIDQISKTGKVIHANFERTAA